MISFLKGRIEDKGKDNVDIDVKGVGYRVYMPITTIEKLDIGKEIKIYTYMRMIQDDVSLYGFLTKEEKHMFELMISVGGIGAKSAINILSNITPSKFALAVITNDINTLKKLQGIGPKTAGRIILELKDKIKTEEAVESGEDVLSSAVDENANEDLIQALLVLGYRRYQINEILPKIKGDTLEEQIKVALMYLANN